MTRVNFISYDRNTREFLEIRKYLPKLEKDNSEKLTGFDAIMDERFPEPDSIDPRDYE